MKYILFILSVSVFIKCFEVKADDTCRLVGKHHSKGVRFTGYFCWSFLHDLQFLPGVKPKSGEFSWEILNVESNEFKEYEKWKSMLDCPCKSSAANSLPKIVSAKYDRPIEIKKIPIIQTPSVVVDSPLSVKSIPPVVVKKMLKLRSIEIAYQSMSDRFMNEKEARTQIRELYDYLMEYSDLKIKLMGVIDNKGLGCSPTHGLALSRAQAVETVLLHEGLPAERIQDVKGAIPGTHLKTPKKNCSDEHPENRRIIIQFFDKNGEEFIF